MKMTDLIGQKLIGVTEPWDDDLEEGEMRLVFEDQIVLMFVYQDRLLVQTDGKYTGDKNDL